MTNRMKKKKKERNVKKEKSISIKFNFFNRKGDFRYHRSTTVGFSKEPMREMTRNRHIRTASRELRESEKWREREKKNGCRDQ